ncbi:lichenase-2 [Impatiens glandulifera]|uniref:lichenase-2 n=1 Tax=Impatiens glandulifera TaxID=253017 RepID=UPI001FB0F4F1|nr:lichenase-2 [Impatiens glandulifera]
MIVSHKSYTFILLLLSLLIAGGTSLPTTIGVTYNPSTIHISPERVVDALESMKIPAIRLISPSPAAIRAFAYSSISLLLCVPNDLVHFFAANRTSAQVWLYSHVVPFYPRAKISAISVGMDVFSAAADLSDDIMPAINNLYKSLVELGIRHISVSTTLSFVNVISGAFPPSTADFQEPMAGVIIKPLLDFLRETNSSFMVNLYPYTVYKLNSDLPIGYAIFQEARFNFRDDTFTGVRYHNLFDSMVDSVIGAMAQAGYEDIPVTVTETGWPSGASGMEADATEVYAEKYIRGLIEHLHSGQGTPLRKEGVAETYIFELFDEDNVQQGSGIAGQKWGILYENMTKKFHFDLSSSEAEFPGWRLGFFCLWLLLFFYCFASRYHSP